MDFKRGSVWRKWDLHIHSDASDGNMSPKEIINKAIELNIEVIALTDHHTAKNIDEILRLGDEKGISVIPGVEFRTEYGDKSVHLIGLFPRNFNGITINSQSITELILNPLNISETAIIQKGAEKLGIQSQGHADECFKNGIFEVQVDFKLASKLIREKLGGIVTVHAGSKSNSFDREMDHEGRPNTDLYNSLGPLKIELLQKYIDICEIKDSSDNKDFYLQEFNKPSISASDAHSLKEIGSKYTWIKANPTLEGLRQIIYEPESRVKIQANNPTLEQKKLVIDTFEINEQSNFIISNEKVEFNRDLVCIIGGRGSGKSALLESLGYCFEAYSKNDNPPSLIPYYQNNSAKAKFILRYKDLDNNLVNSYTSSLQEKNEFPCSYPFLYISQNQIEKYAADKSYLHGLAFNTISKNSSYSERMFSIQDNIDDLLKKNEDNVNKIITKRESLKNNDQKLLEIETNKLKEELYLLESESTRRVLSELNEAQDKKAVISTIKQIKEEILEALNSTSEYLDGKLQDFYPSLDNLKISYVPLTYNFDDIKNYLSDIVAQVDIIDREIGYHALVEKYKSIVQDKIDVSIEHLEALKKKIASNELRIKAYSKEKEVLSNLIKTRNQNLLKLNSYFTEYLSIYNSAVNEFSTMNKDILGPLELESLLVFDPEPLLEHLLRDYVDKRKIKSIESLRSYLNLSAEISHKEYISWIENKISNEFEVENYDIFYTSQKSDIEKGFLSIHPKLSTKIKYKIGDETKDIDKLSLGQKGTILLKLFLSAGNNCPIVMDQPEDHLDNSFIYEDLVKTIRNAKIKRQIIVVTHNANLVVNGDAEQIIIANYENERISHLLSGSLEDPIIKEKVKLILEGGKEAFRRREEKYQ